MRGESLPKIHCWLSHSVKRAIFLWKQCQNITYRSCNLSEHSRVARTWKKQNTTRTVESVLLCHFIPLSMIPIPTSFANFICYVFYINRICQYAFFHIWLFFFLSLIHCWVDCRSCIPKAEKCSIVDYAAICPSRKKTFFAILMSKESGSTMQCSCDFWVFQSSSAPGKRVILIIG